MNVTVIGAGHSGLAMAAHLSACGEHVSLWNRTASHIKKLMDTHVIHCEGYLEGAIEVEIVTDDLQLALASPDVIIITTPAFSHRPLARQIAQHLTRDALIVLHPGRTFGALEFLEEFQQYNEVVNPIVAEAQTNIYTCRKTTEDSVHIITIKSDVLISTFSALENERVFAMLPECLQPYFVPAKSMIETSIGNVGMIFHCTPMLLNAGWTENENHRYKYYYEGITPSIGKFIEKVDMERILVAEKMGRRVESAIEWLKRSYHVEGDTIYECIQNNEAYKDIEAPGTLRHRYIIEDVPYGLVPLEDIGKKLGLAMTYTGIVIDLASMLLNMDFRKIGRKVDNLHFVIAGDGHAIFHATS